ncbi:Hypothetical protein PBC10988_7570 [Planctomycetales bacterium 10988]|nr:Hypothetical protein PBC10988_7570 [Planctomycetales bacterium 10988]
MEEIAEALEQGELSVSDSMSAFEEGCRLLAECQTFLEEAQRKIEILTGFDAQGQPIVEDFEVSSEKSEKTEVSSRKSSSSARSKTPRSKSSNSKEHKRESSDDHQLF